MAPDQTTASGAAYNVIATGELTPFAPEFLIDPYPIYHYLRTNDPVHWTSSPAMGDWGFWWLTRYADVIAALKDPRLGREESRLVPPDAEPAGPDAHQLLHDMLGRWMLFRDPPTHTRLRGLVSKAFTPRMIERLRPRIEGIAEQLIDEMVAHEQADIIGAFAFPLPVVVIAELLGVPASDRDRFREWSNVIARVIDLGNSEETLDRGTQVTQEMGDYFRGLFAKRRRQPQEDLISAMLATHEQGDTLSEDEVLANCILLLFAGHETTINLVGNGLLALLRNPEQRRLLAEHPELGPAAVEELLRYDSPVQLTFRTAFEDLTIGDQRIQRGQSICTALGGANRDPALFPDPDGWKARSRW
jgi:pimeloyl-[acyl-carrier protein] synthase